MTENNIKTLKRQVEEILKVSLQARDSDTYLMIEIWKAYYGVIGDQISLFSLYKLPRLAVIARLRRKTQNTEKKYPPTDWRVAQRRGWNRDEWKKVLGYYTEPVGQKKFSFV